MRHHCRTSAMLFILTTIGSMGYLCGRSEASSSAHSSSKATKNESSCPDEIPLQMLPMGIWGPENMKIENIWWRIFDFSHFLEKKLKKIWKKNSIFFFTKICFSELEKAYVQLFVLNFFFWFWSTKIDFWQFWGIWPIFWGLPTPRQKKIQNKKLYICFF